MIDCQEIEIAREARAFIEPAGQTLSVGLATARVTFDRGRIGQMFMNLLTNASKYSPPDGAIMLSVAVEPGFVRFDVGDQEPGIPAESVARVFERFSRAPGQDRKQGAGPRLAITRRIVVAHGGSIACACESGCGAEFYFLLPG